MLEEMSSKQLFPGSVGSAFFKNRTVGAVMLIILDRTKLFLATCPDGVKLGSDKRDPSGV